MGQRATIALIRGRSGTRILLANENLGVARKRSRFMISLSTRYITPCTVSHARRVIFRSYTSATFQRAYKCYIRASPAARTSLHVHADIPGSTLLIIIRNRNIPNVPRERDIPYIPFCSQVRRAPGPPRFALSGSHF